MQNYPSTPKDQSRVCVLWLVICKTARVQVGNLLTTLIIILGPMIVFVIYSTTIFLARKTTDEVYKRPPPIDIRTDVPSIYYSPTNDVIDRVIRFMVMELDPKEFRGFKNGTSMIEELTEEDGFVGIEFDDNLIDITKLPSKVTVSILFPKHLRTTPKMMWETGALYRHLHLTADYYRFEGFLIVQSKLSEALIREKNSSVAMPKVFLEHLPGPWSSESELNERRLSLAGFLVLPFTISAAFLTQLIVRDRQEHVTAMLELMHVNSWIHWTSWFIIGFVLLALPTVLLVMLQKGRFYPKADMFVILTFLLVYIVELLCSSFMISVFVNDSIMVQIAILILHLMSWLPWRLLLKGYQGSFLRTLVSCFFLYSSLTVGLHQLIEHETLYRGMEFDHIFTYSDQEEHFCIGIVILIMLLGSVFRILVLFYVEALRGIRPRKWYFPFQRSFWCPRKRSADDVESESVDQEQGHRDRPLVIRARKLVKIYNNNKVVDNFTLTCYQDEITVIMGHNDSGKTTILMMLSGIVRPTSGTVIINGYDMDRETSKARQSMSFCPQRNILFEKNKVKWHINFYCRLKGMNRSDAAEETKRYLQVCHLEEYASHTVQELSSGMKRMLSVCCALCGHTKIVLLDEPGTSMDPLVRRDMWDLLRKERMGRCIIVSTHNMYEAEILADNIVMLCDGRVFGYGTPAFLTQAPELGAIFKLTCTKDDSCLVSEVTHFLQKRIPDIVLDKEYNLQVSYMLPTKNIRDFSTLFGDLEESLENLKITGFSVEAPTLSNMFFRIGEEMHAALDRSISVLRMSQASPFGSLINLLPSFDVREDNPIQIVHNQWRAILGKKWIFTKRHQGLYIVMILFPILTFIMVFLSEFLFYWILGTPHPKVMTNMQNYTNRVLLTECIDDNVELINVYTQMGKDQKAMVINTEEEPIYNFALSHMLKYEMELQQSFLCGITVNLGNKTVIAWQNTMLEHGSALSLGLVYQAIGKHMAGIDIEIVNKPRQDHFTDVVIGLNEFNSVEFSSFVCFYLVLATATFAVMPVLERETDLRHLQLSSGMGRATYWMAHMAWDFSTYMVMVFSLILVVGLTTGTAVPMMILLLAFGYAAIAFTYLISLFSGNIGSLFSLVMYINMLGVVAIFIHPYKEKRRFLVFECILLILPHYALFCGEQNILTEDERFYNYQGRVSEQARKAGKIDRAHMSRNPVLYNNIELLYLLISGIVYFLLVIYSWIPRRIAYCLKAIRNEQIHPNTQDEDIEVQRLRQRMDDITKNKFVNFPLILRKVTKRYNDLVAVQCLTVDLNSFECLCLLGRNGAGKSSTFYMIVGKIPITAGGIYIKGLNVKRNRRALRHVGFCPREPTLANYMTGRQMLHFSCLINGVRRNLIPNVVNHMEQSFLLDRQLDTPIGNCNNGMKRKLMLAIASMAPTLICLDEPTAGVDMNAKYTIWHVLDNLRLGGLAILVTTTSMQECEVLATNVGILERGSLLCYGSLTRLKNRFDKNIYVKVKVGSKEELADAKEEFERFDGMLKLRQSTWLGDTPLLLRESSSSSLDWRPVSAERLNDGESRQSESQMRSMYEKLLREVEIQFLDDHPDSKMSHKYTYRGIIIFSIPKDKVRYSKLFHYMETRKHRMQVLYYSISHTTLEDVFLDFISKHHVDP
ncbi:uncharacterized protein Dana_GF12256 [Drosophila ananassae]|uniref:ABC transporter domain-containing protein n=1 Tax=Drosophila ananassae TaxID=7217 RepID=B3MHM3_DROAN|nr:ATP-binding cassette sub-family A member 2 [Drosophila ananassae]EDV35859.2 uncharacterized protein Dana_GF12256 [Drosophila ananassae]